MRRRLQLQLDLTHFSLDPGATCEGGGSISGSTCQAWLVGSVGLRPRGVFRGSYYPQSVSLGEHFIFQSEGGSVSITAIVDSNVSLYTVGKDGAIDGELIPLLYSVGREYQFQVRPSLLRMEMLCAA